MPLDLIFTVLMIIAVVKGLRRGFIIALFSVVAFIIGLAAALKLSALVAGWLQGTEYVSARWLPVVSFLLIFIGVALLIRWGANLLEATVEMALLGWVNKLAGVLLYTVLYTLCFSVVLFFAEQVRLIGPETIKKSVTYGWVQPWGPVIINGVGKWIPVFKDMFSQLEAFFDHIVKKAAA